MKIAKVISLVTLWALSSLFVTAVFAIEDAGRVMFVAGKATVINAAGQERVARKGDFLKQGDRLVTSDKGMIQVKMPDDGVMAVRPGTELKLNDMVPQLNKTDMPSQALLLTRGGVRVLTGNERNKTGYQISTASTTIGLREGDTEALVIPKPLPAAGRSADPMPAGTYNRMNAGTGTIQGAAGKGISLAANQTSFTPSVNTAPVLVASLPPRYINTTVPLPLDSVAKPPIATIAPSPAGVSAGMVVPPPKFVEPPIAVLPPPKFIDPPIAVLPPPKFIDPPIVVLPPPKFIDPPIVVLPPPKIIDPPIVVAPPVIPPKIITLPPPTVVAPPPIKLSDPIVVAPPAPLKSI